LFVSIVGHAPWSTQLRDEDVVRVDTSQGYLVVETKGRPRFWFDSVVQQSYVRDFADGVILLLRIESGTGTSRHWTPEPGITVVGFVDMEENDLTGTPPLPSGRVGPDRGLN
jgi:hypothetical protein